MERKPHYHTAALCSDEYEGAALQKIRERGVANAVVLEARHVQRLKLEARKLDGAARLSRDGTRVCQR